MLGKQGTLMVSNQWGTGDPFVGVASAREAVNAMRGDLAAARQRWRSLQQKHGVRRSFWSRFFRPDLITSAEQRWVLLDCDLRQVYEQNPMEPDGNLAGPDPLYRSRKMEKKRGVEGLRSSIPFLIIYSPIHKNALSWLNWPENETAWELTYRFLQNPLSEKTPVATFITAATLSTTWEEFETFLDLPESMVETMLRETLAVWNTTRTHPATSSR